MNLTQGGRNVTQARSSRSEDRGRQQTARRAPKKPPRRLPDSGYFADVDPNAEVRSSLSFVENPDIKKRPGRYQSDFIWNTDWESQLDNEAAAEERQKKARAAPTPVPSGGLGLSRLQQLNSMEVDLSEQLRRRKVQPDARQDKASTSSTRTSEIPPTQADSRRWQRSGKFSSRAVYIPEASEEEALAIAKAAAEKVEYDRLKMELQLWTLAASLFGFSSIWLAYSRETAISYGVGAVGSFMYLRMLNRSIDSVAGGGLGGALGQPRLLIPFALALGYNRWNKVYAVDSGVVLQLLPMLLGFFTYKAAVVSKQAATLLTELSVSASGDSEQGL